MEKKILELKNVYAGYDKKSILHGIDFEVRKSDFVGIIGPNGGGKTTLLKVILGLIKPFSGEILYNFNEDKSQFRSFIGYLPQQSTIDRKFPISVSEVVLSGLISKQTGFGSLSGLYKKRVEEVLKLVGMIELKKAPVGELSGGQLQRVFLGRAIIADPQLLILDEPDTFVDNRFEHELYQLLKELNNSMAILLVSHDIGTISSYIKTIACVNNHLHYHPSNEISSEQLKVYNCPIDIITHGTVPHRVLSDHEHTVENE